MKSVHGGFEVLPSEVSPCNSERQMPMQIGSFLCKRPGRALSLHIMKTVHILKESDAYIVNCCIHPK